MRDYRETQIRKMANVDIYLDSDLSADQIMEFGFENVAIATGASWRRDGVARFHLHPITIDDKMPVFTPDDLMDGSLPTGKVVLYDDDHYYMGGVLAELLVNNGCQVKMITPSAYISDWTRNTLEQTFIQRRLIELDVAIHVSRAVSAIAYDHIKTECIYSGRGLDLAADAVVLVTSRLANDMLWHALKAREADWPAAGIKSIKVIGDAEAPAPIAWAVYAGHRFARELDEVYDSDAVPFRREVAKLATD